MVRRFCLLSVTLFAAIVLAGCGKARTTGKPEPLLMHAGAGLAPALKKIAREFNDPVRFLFKGSGFFIADVTLSREGDLYMPGEMFYMQQAVDRGLIKDYKVAAYFVTVIITPRGNPAHITSIKDFARPGVRVGIGDAKACAIGTWHKRIFSKAGIWDEVKKNVKLTALCIPELGNATKLGHIDGTIVWNAVAAQYLRDCEVVLLPKRLRGVIPLPVGILVFSKHPKRAEKFRSFILSDEGKKVFLQYGYSVEKDEIDRDLARLVAAAKAAKEPPSAPLDEKLLGPLSAMVKEQRRKP